MRNALHRLSALAALVLLLAAPLSRVAAQPEPEVAAPAAAIAIERRFQEGLAALAAGDPATAIRRFTAILAGDPGLHRVRLELARAYFVAEDWTDSRREFFAVLSADVPDPVKVNIIRFLRLIDERRGWSWDLDAGLRGGPDDGRRYSSDTVRLNIGGVPLPFAIDRPKGPDWGAFVLAGLERHERLVDLAGGATLSGIARIDGLANLYEGSDFDELILGGSMAAQVSWPRTTLRLGPDATWRRIGDDPRERRLGGSAAVEHRLPEGVALLGRIALSRVEDELSDARDGWLRSARAGVSWSLGGRSSITAILGVDSLDARFGTESYRSGRLELRGTTDLGYGLAPSLRLAASQTRYQDQGALFFNRRNDRQLAIDLELEKRDLFLGPFIPFISAGYTRNVSNIELYDYHETRYRVGLRKMF